MSRNRPYASLDYQPPMSGLSVNDLLSNHNQRIGKNKRSGIPQWPG